MSLQLAGAKPVGGGDYRPGKAAIGGFTGFLEGVGIAAPPTGFVYILGADSAYLLGADGAYLLGIAP